MGMRNRRTFGPTLSALLILASAAFMMNPPSAAGATVYPVSTLSLGSAGALHWVTDGFVAYTVEPSPDRMGAIDTAGTRPRGNAVSLGGPLFDLGPIRFGSIASFGYTRAAIDGHTAGFAASFARPAGNGVVVSVGFKTKF